MDPAAVRSAPWTACDHVVHLASIAGVDTVMKHAGADHAHLAARHRQRARRGARVAAAASASSTSRRSEVFGRYAYHVTEFDVTTLGAVGEARWTYAVAKLATEHLAMTYHRQYGFPAVLDPPVQHLRPAPGGRGRGAPLHRARAQGRAAARCTTTARRSAPGATSTTSSTRSSACSPTSAPSATRSTSATRARR